MRLDRTIFPVFAPLLVQAAVLFLANDAFAQAPPAAERLHDYSAYERETIDRVLAERNLMTAAEPEGKLVERVEIVPLDVFEERDVLPRWLNVFHVTTRANVIRGEVLLHPGDHYAQALVDDTIRNLRRLPGVPQLSAVLVVAARGSSPERVVLVVVTKDVWSLRLNWDVVATSGGLNQLVLQPSETNFLGTHQILGATFVLQPSTFTVGAHYLVPRLDHSRIAVQASADVMFNRSSGTAEGSYGGLVVGEPLFAGDTAWSWDANVAWQDVFLRRYVDAQVYPFVDPSTRERIPFEYHSRTTTANYELTRSFGWDVNHDFTLGAGVSRAVYAVPTPPTAVSARTVQDFASQYVPLSDTRVGPSLQYHSYRMRFVRVIDFDTLALQEDYRLGHDVVARVYPSLKAFGSSRDVIGLYGAAQYTWALRDGLFRVALASTTEPEPSRIADASLMPSVHLASPTISGLGRVVLDGSATWRWRNYLNATSTLGGESRLRGYPTSFLVGANVAAYNVELRTRPIEVLSMELGGVAFWDVGDAWSDGTPGASLAHFQPLHSVGVGIRTLFPWLDRTVFQADIGFPLERPLDPTTGALVPPYSFIVSFGQAFSTPTIAPTPVLPTGQGPDSP